MKIAYIVNNYRAESELWLQRQIEILKDDIRFIATTDNDNKEGYWKNTIPVINLYSDYPLVKKIATKLKLIKARTPRERNNEILSKKLKKDVSVIFVNYLTLAYRLRKTLINTDLPIIIHTHGYDITWDLISISTGERLYNEEYFSFVKHISKKALLIANSNESKSRLIELGVPESRVVIKYFGVPLENMKAPNSHKTYVKILYLGRLVDCKAPDLVIRAFDLACDRGMHGELVIAGEGPLRTTCRLMQKRSKYKDRIKLVGLVDAEEGRKLRSECDIFTAHNCKGALTNQLEAFGVSIIEAMAAGLPVVTGRSGGVLDSVIHGETGFLVAPGNISEHANRLLQLANDSDLRAQMGEEAARRVRDNFSIDQERTSLIEIFRSTITCINPDLT